MNWEGARVDRGSVESYLAKLVPEAENGMRSSLLQISSQQLAARWPNLGLSLFICKTENVPVL